MPIYTGKSADGRDAIQTGVYVSPDGKEWSTCPYTDEQREHAKQVRRHWKVWCHIEKNRRTMREEYELIKQKKSILDKACRNYVIACIEQES